MCVKDYETILQALKIEGTSIRSRVCWLLFSNFNIQFPEFSPVLNTTNMEILLIGKDSDAGKD